jgi:2-iminobutanoate/2-iminopropanoate deaminase
MSHARPPPDAKAPSGGSAAPRESSVGALSRVGQPMANYAVARRAGNLLFVSGIVAVDPGRVAIVQSYEELPAHAREQLRAIGYDTGQMSVDAFEAPAVAQSWFVLDRVRQVAREHGAEMDDAIKLVQYFRDLRHYPFFNRVRGLFYPTQPPASTVVEVARFLPSDAALIEVEATIYLGGNS